LTVCRLFVYYVLYLSVWRCPPGLSRDELVEGDAPQLCYPLHHGFDLVRPYVEPGYHAYVEPAVEHVSPYVNKGKNAYLTYVHPTTVVVSNKISSRFDPYNEKVKQWHAEKVQPVLDRGYEKTAPYMENTQQVIGRVYDGYIVPSAHAVYPHLVRTRNVVEARLMPYVYKASAKSMDFSSKYGRKAWNWVTGSVSPRIAEVYHDAIEPQIIKIQSRVNQDSNSASTVEATDSASVSSTIAEPTMTEEPTTTSTTASESTSTSTNVEEPKPVKTGESVSEELLRWKEIVKQTTSDALNTLLDDIELEKQKMMAKVRPEFEDLVEKLETAESAAFAELNGLVSNINSTEEEVTTGMVQQSFREHAENIRDAAFAVRKRAETFAEEVLKETEKLRTGTVEVLDEFGEVSLQEIGRKMVSLDSAASESATSVGSAPNWKDWKEYRNLKDALLTARQEIVDLDINMAEVNLMLRQAQERANTLAKEAAQLLSSLRAKADAMFQERLKKMNEEREMAGEPMDDTPQDAEIYDAEDEDEEEEEEEEPQRSKQKNEEEDEYADYVPKGRRYDESAETDTEEEPVVEDQQPTGEQEDVKSEKEEGEQKDLQSDHNDEEQEEDEEGEEEEGEEEEGEEEEEEETIILTFTETSTSLAATPTSQHHDEL
jgi:hypothetical protein